MARRAPSRTRNLSSNRWESTDRIYAQNGVVMIQKKDGTLTSLKVKEAARRAYMLHRSLGNPNMPKDQRKIHEDFIEMIVPVLREARAQLESPDKKTTLLHRSLTNTDENGKKYEITFDSMLSSFCLEFSNTMDEDDIRAIMKEFWPDVTKVEQLLAMEHIRRLRDIMRSNAQAAQITTAYHGTSAADQGLHP